MQINDQISRNRLKLNDDKTQVVSCSLYAPTA